MNPEDELQNKMDNAVSGLSNVEVEEESIPEETVLEDENTEVNDEGIVEGVEPAEAKDHTNFARLRAKNEEIGKERDYFRRKTEEYERAYAQYYSQLKSQEAAKPEPSRNQFAPTDLVEHQHIQRYDDELKNIKDGLAKQQQQVAQQQDNLAREAADKRLLEEFPDFNEVSSKENVERFFKNHPVEAAVVVGSKDWYSFGRAYYSMAKGVGITSHGSSGGGKERAVSNMNKPRTMTSSTPRNTPLSHASSFESMTDEMLIKEMYESTR